MSLQASTAKCSRSGETRRRPAALPGLLFLLASLLAGPATVQAQSTDFDDAGLAAEMLEKHIRPGYAAFREKTAAMKSTFEASCKTPDKGNAAKAQASFRETVLAWSRIEHLRFGPVVDANRLERIMFWPDRQRIGERQIQQILDKRDETALSVDELKKKSAAVQGLTALEILLAAKAELVWADSAEGRFACGYATAITANLDTMASEIVAAWAAGGAYAELWLKPGDKNPVYKNQRGTSLETLKAYRFGLNNVRDGKLLGALGQKRLRPDGPFAPKAKAPFDQSGLAVAAMQANIEGISDMYENGGLAQRHAFADQDRSDLIRTTLTEALRALGAVETKAGKAPLAPESEADLAKVPQTIAAAFRLGGDSLENAVTGAVLGFKEDDGD